jgi:hypothetical protein
MFYFHRTREGMQPVAEVKRVTSIAALPRVPAVYCLYGGRGRDVHAAYIGVADSLRQRIGQHLVNRDSSISTGTTVVGLRPEYATEVRWWENRDFSSRDVLLAAELVAFDVLDPALRSRGGIQQSAYRLYEDAVFRERMERLIREEISGVLVVPTLLEALNRIDALEHRMSEMERRLLGS